MPELPEVEITARRLDTALTGARGGVGAGAGDERDEDLRATARQSWSGARSPGCAGRQDAGGRVRRPGAADPPDVGRAAARLRQAGLAQRPGLAGAGATRGRARAAAARVRHQAARLGQAARDRGRRGGRSGRDARAGGLAAAANSRPSPRRSTSPGTCTRCSATSATSPASAAPGSTRSSGRRGSLPSSRAPS